MNMNEQSVGTPLSKNWTQLAEPKEERTRFHLGQESLQRISAKTAVFLRNGHSWLYQGRYRVILTWLSISCIKKQKRKKNYTIQATAMKKSRINSV